MDDLKTKTAAPIPPVGAGREQPISLKTTSSIAEEEAENNPPEKKYREMLRQMQRMNDSAYLPTVTMQELYETVYQSRPPVIDGLLYSGTYLFAGAPKVGKSFLVAQLAYHVSTGQKLWGYDVHPGTVLYLALEDDYRRLQGRMSRMFDVESTDKLHFTAAYPTNTNIAYLFNVTHIMGIICRSSENMYGKHGSMCPLRTASLPR